MTGEPFPDRFRRWYRMLPPAMRVLLTVNTVLYVAWLIVRGIGGRAAAGFVIEYLTLIPAVPEALFRPWQLLTYAFLHVQPGLWGFIAFGFNMLWLYWLGREYEEFYGSHLFFWRRSWVGCWRWRSGRCSRPYRSRWPERWAPCWR